MINHIEEKLLKGTGKPSEERISLQHFAQGADEACCNIDPNKSLLQVIFTDFESHQHIPAFKYINKIITRSDVVCAVDSWMRTFRALGIEDGDIVPIYGPATPAIGIQALALVGIGATANFLKLSISKEDLEQQTEDAKFAIVFDLLYKNVQGVFSDTRFKNVLVATSSDLLALPVSKLADFKTYKLMKNSGTHIPKDKRFIYYDDAISHGKYYSGQVLAPVNIDRLAFITSSSGTSGMGVKACMATQKSAIAQILQDSYAEYGYEKGSIFYNNLPFTASTSISALFNVPLHHGMTIHFNPVIKPAEFHLQLLKAKPAVVITTGGMWRLCLQAISKMNPQPDMSWLKAGIIGGEGITVFDLESFDNLLHSLGSHCGGLVGCGMSEIFSTGQANLPRLGYTPREKKHIVPSIGVDFPGIVSGVFNEYGNELGYNER